MSVKNWHPAANSGVNSIAKIENATWQPAIEIKETDSSIILQVQVPGIESEDLDIDVSKDVVSITGEHQEKNVHNETGVYYSEFDYGHFQRIVQLPVCIDHKQVKAEIHNGILTLNLPKSSTEKNNMSKPDLTVEPKVS